MFELPQGITIWADGFGRWLPCQIVARVVYAQGVGPVGLRVPIEVRYAVPRKTSKEAVEHLQHLADKVRARLERAGYVSVALTRVKG